MLSEHSDEIGDIAVSALIGAFGDGFSFREKGLRVVDSKILKILTICHAGDLLKVSAKIGFRQACYPGSVCIGYRTAYVYDRPVDQFDEAAILRKR